MTEGAYRCDSSSHRSAKIADVGVEDFVTDSPFVADPIGTIDKEQFAKEYKDSQEHEPILLGARFGGKDYLKGAGFMVSFLPVSI